MKKFLEKARLVMIILTLVVIIFSSFMGIYKYLKALFSKDTVNKKQLQYYELRIFISESLVLALTFLLGADIIGSMVQSSLTNLSRLVVIFLFRLVVTYFVDKDIKTLAAEEKSINS